MKFEGVVDVPAHEIEKVLEGLIPATKVYKTEVAFQWVDANGTRIKPPSVRIKVMGAS